MCGICVQIESGGPADLGLVRAMCDRIVHRGPDSEGIEVDGPVGLGMRRLSIIDLEGGRQPIHNEDRSLAIVFNGEIYNYRELRDELIARGHRFATGSDTEVVVHLYEEAGERAVERLRGMFAFAIHERATGRVFFARDRLGIKPLHYVDTGRSFFAVSELKSLHAVPGLDLTIDPAAVDQYFSLLYIPGPRTIYREVKKVPPGHTMVKDPGRPAVLRRYWRLDSRPESGRSESDWVDGFRERFDDAVASHLVADVPVGAFLSGGVDSGAIVAAMARAAPGRVKTFSLGFPADYADFDERRHARRIAAMYGTSHEEVEADPDVRDLIVRLGAIFDEPMGDSGALPNLIVSQLARRSLTVALSGLGGDELAGGYQRYLGVLVADWFRKLPRGVRRGVLQRVADLVPESRKGLRGVDRAKRFLRDAELPAIDRFFAFSSPIERSRRAALYRADFRERVELDSALDRMRALADEQTEADPLNKLLGIDQQMYMVDDLLTVADRTSMAASLEVRVPFLDHPLVEYMARVPGRLKIKGWRKKHLLKRAFEADLPRDLLHRPKAGFSLPVARWLREDLRGMLEDYLGRDRLDRRGFFDVDVVEALKAEHMDRRRNHASILWALLMFELWLDHHGAPTA